MIHKQRFFERTDGSTQPLAHGYGRVSHPDQFEKGDSLEGQEDRIGSFIKSNSDTVFSGVHYAGMFPEPLAQSAQKRPFNMRPMGKELVEKLQPGDHVIVDKFDRIFRSIDDFCLMNRWFIEHGIRLHVLNMMGLQFDSQSAVGNIVATMMAGFAQFENDLRAERIRDARARLRGRKLHSGGGVPRFCEVVGQAPGKKCGAGGKLRLKPWAMPLFEKIVHLRDVEGMGWFKMAGDIWREFKTSGFKQPHPKKYEEMYDFYKGWKEMGFPDINEIRVIEVRENHRRKRMQEKKDG